MMKKIRNFFTPDLIAILLIIAVTSGVFLTSLDFEINYMDDYFYTQRKWLMVFSWHNICYWLTHNVLGLYSPLVMYTYMVDMFICGADHFIEGIRVQNIFWHITACSGLYAILRTLEFKRQFDTPLKVSPFFAFWAVMFFAVHPQRIESVVWISERKDVLVMSLGLWATWFFMRGVKNNRCSITAVVLIFLSLFTKPMMCTVIGVWWLYLVAERRNFSPRAWLKYLWPVATVIGLYTGVLALLFDGVSKNQFNFVYILKLMVRNYGLYFFKTCIPYNLNPLYPIYNPEYESILPGVIVIALTVMLLLLGKFSFRYREMAWFGYLPLLLAFFGVLLPVSGLMVVGNVDYADRYSYFPAVFIYISAGFTLQWLNDEFCRYRKLIRAIPPVYLAVLLILTGFHLNTWSSQRRFMTAAIDTAHPHRNAIYYFSGMAVERGDVKALEQLLSLLYEQSRSGDDKLYAVMFRDLSMGMCLINSGKEAEGIKHLNRILTRKEWSVLTSMDFILVKSAFTYAAKYHHRHGNRHYAVKFFTMLSQSIKAFDSAESLFYLGMAHFIRGDLKTAERCFEQSLQLFADDRNVRHNLETVRNILKKRSSNQQKTPVINEKR